MGFLISLPNVMQMHLDQDSKKIYSICNDAIKIQLLNRNHKMSIHNDDMLIIIGYNSSRRVSTFK